MRGKITPEQREAARKRLEELLRNRERDDDGDTSWNDSLPQYPGLPSEEGKVTAVFIPGKKGKKGKKKDKE